MESGEYKQKLNIQIKLKDSLEANMQKEINAKDEKMGKMQLKLAEQHEKIQEMEVQKSARSNASTREVQETEKLRQENEELLEALEIGKKELSEALDQLKDYKRRSLTKDDNVDESFNSIEDKLNAFEIDVQKVKQDGERQKKMHRDVKELRDSLTKLDERDADLEYNSNYLEKMESGAIIFCKRTSFSDQAWFLLRKNDTMLPAGESGYFWVN